MVFSLLWFGLTSGIFISRTKRICKIRRRRVIWN
nr:MAG TPA: hypothetical protein [Caudoviricetes sp.]